MHPPPPGAEGSVVSVSMHKARLCAGDVRLKTWVSSGKGAIGIIHPGDSHGDSRSIGEWAGVRADANGPKASDIWL